MKIKNSLADADASWAADTTERATSRVPTFFRSLTRASAINYPLYVYTYTMETGNQES